jgi:putative nucleotidyltransferase with HDIG domain
VASVAQGLAKRLCPRKESTARMAGLLHDVGKQVLAGMRPLDPDGWQGPPPGEETEWERRVFGVSHDVVGGWLCRRFHAPEELWRAVHEHHAPRAPLDPVSRTTWLASIVVAADGRPGDVEAARRALEVAGVDPRWLERSTGVSLRPPCPLTARELEALGLLWERGSGQAAAEEMGVDVGEFEGMMVRSCKALDVPSVTRAIATCRRLGWLGI